jgi:hypothetical protein
MILDYDNHPQDLVANVNLPVAADPFTVCY